MSAKTLSTSWLRGTPLGASGPSPQTVIMSRVMMYLPVQMRIVLSQSNVTLIAYTCTLAGMRMHGRQNI